MREIHALVTLGRAAVLAVGVVAATCSATFAQGPNADSQQVARLFAAVQQGDAAAVQRYLAQGVPYDAKNELGLTALHLAVYQRQEDVVRTILAALPAAAQTPTPGQPQNFDAYLDSISFDRFQATSRRNDFLNMATSQGQTALHLAVGPLAENEAVYARLVAALCEAGANPNLSDRLGHTPLHWAAKNGYAQVVKALVEHGANPSARTSTGQTAAELATAPAIRAMLAQAAANPPPGRGEEGGTLVDMSSDMEGDTPVDLFSAVAGDQPPPNHSQPSGPDQNGDSVRVLVIDDNGQVRELDFYTLQPEPNPGSGIHQPNPAGMAPGGIRGAMPTDGGFPTGHPLSFDPPPPARADYVLSSQQQKLQSRLGFPDLFNIMFVSETVGSKTINTRIERWAYFRGGKMFSFCDGECVLIEDLKLPVEVKGALIRYNPSQFTVGMTQVDLHRRFGADRFKQLSLAAKGFQNPLMRQMSFWSDGAVTLSFQDEQLIAVQALCTLPKQP